MKASAGFMRVCAWMYLFKKLRDRVGKFEAGATMADRLVLIQAVRFQPSLLTVWLVEATMQ